MTRAEGVWIWLSRVHGLGAGRARELVAYFGGEEELLAAGEAALREAVGPALAQSLLEARKQEEINDHVRACRAAGVSIVTPASPAYPESLQEIYDPPCALYARGDLSLLRSDCLTIVGTRRHTQYGRRVTEKFASALAQAGLTIVSGLAEGLDSVAHQAALDAGGKTIAVLANGLDVAYPAGVGPLQEEIARRGLVVSEYPLGTRAGRNTLLPRNRLLAALSRATLITEAGQRSGTLLVAGLAVDYGREILTVPGNIDSPASYSTNRLLRTSAEMALCPEDVLQALGMEEKAEKRKVRAAGQEAQPALTEEEKRILQFLRLEPLSFDELIARTQFSASKLNSLLTMLELKGIIDQSAGRTYATKS
jgi:DNA processing protein